MERQDRIDLIKKFQRKNIGKVFFEEGKDDYLKFAVTGITDFDLSEGYMLRKFNDKYHSNVVELYYGDTLLVSGFDLSEEIEKSKIPTKRRIKYGVKLTGSVAFTIAALAIPVIMTVYPFSSAIRTKHNPFKLDETGYHTTKEIQIDKNNEEKVTYSEEYYEEETGQKHDGKELFAQPILEPKKQSTIEKYGKPLFDEEGKKYRIVETYDVTDVSVDTVKSYLSKEEKVEISDVFGEPIEQKIVDYSDTDSIDKEYYKATLYVPNETIVQTHSKNFKELLKFLIFTIGYSALGFLIAFLPAGVATALENEEQINTQFALKKLRSLKKQLKKVQKQKKLSLKLKEDKHEIL